MKTYLLQLRNLDDCVVLNSYEVSFPSNPPPILLVDNTPYLKKFVLDNYPSGSKATIPIVCYSQSDIGIICLPDDLKIKYQ